MPDQPPQPYCDDELRTVVVRVQRAFNVAEIEGQCSDEESKTVPLRLAATLDHLKAEIARKDAALREITKREGEFSLDQLEHAHNTIEHAVQLATNALAPAPHPPKDAP